MISGATLLGFALSSLAIIVVPGPSVLFVISRAVALGRRAALLTVFGNCVGVYVQVIAVAFGLGTLIERIGWLFHTVKFVGAAYLVWLGFQAFRHRGDLAAAVGSETIVRSKRRVLVDGFIVGLTNPKSLVFFGAVLPQFVDVGRGSVVAQMLLLGLVFEVVAFVSDGAWGLAAGSARSWLMRSPRRLSVIGGAGGLAIIGLGVRLALSGRRD